ncbi:MAG: hypothetical protein Q8R69_09145 [Telluria sp.]|nr:hypothetical protein [Telluria sp.]
MSQQINLFNPVFLKQKKIFTCVAMVQALAVLLIGVLALGWYARQSIGALQRDVDASAAQLERKKTRLAAVKAEFLPRSKSRELEARIAAAEAELKGLKEVAAVLQRGQFGNTEGYSEYFRAFARQSAGGLWLTAVSIVGAGADIGVQGRALQPALVPAFIGRLTAEPVMKGKTFDSLQIKQAQPNKPGAAAGDAASYVEFALQSGAAAAAGEPAK